jgi:adenylate cyclase
VAFVIFVVKIAHWKKPCEEAGVAKEIERKYLVKGGSWKRGATKRVAVRQGYLSTDKEKVVRVRTTGEKGFLGVKGGAEGITREEYEYEIPRQDAEEMLDAFCSGRLIEKTRYLVEHLGLLWEVDEFLGDNQGLVVAEVELEREDQPIQKPDWVGEEVTGDPRYLNANLVSHPYGEWRKKEGVKR